jgi:hypothetical protein
MRCTATWRNTAARAHGHLVFDAQAQRIVFVPDHS